MTEKEKEAVLALAHLLQQQRVSHFRCVREKGGLAPINQCGKYNNRCNECVAIDAALVRLDKACGLDTFSFISEWFEDDESIKKVKSKLKKGKYGKCGPFEFLESRVLRKAGHQKDGLLYHKFVGRYYRYLFYCFTDGKIILINTEDESPLEEQEYEEQDYDLND